MKLSERLTPEQEREILSHVEALARNLAWAKESVPLKIRLLTEAGIFFAKISDHLVAAKDALRPDEGK